MSEPNLDNGSPRPRRRWNKPLAGFAAAAVVLVIGITTLSLMTPDARPPAASTATVAGTPSTTTGLPLAPADVIVGIPEDGFADVITALDQASERWQPNEDFRYAFRVNIDCNCPDVGSRWVRFFQEEGNTDPWDVTAIFDRIRNDIERQPDRIEVAFSSGDGHPTYYSVKWPDSSDADDLVLGVDGFREISSTSVFDGEWRFTTGAVDGAAFGNPVTQGAITLTLGQGLALFPVDCNQGGAWVDIHEEIFGVGSIGTTAAGCSDYSAEAAMFVTALERAESIRVAESELIITGPGVELRFVNPSTPESLGELPFTAAGEILLLEFPDGRNRGVIYTISAQSRPLGEYIEYVLTAEAEGVDSVAGWEEWGGEFDVPDIVVTGPGPDRIVIPDTIQVGDYLLCSPYWESDPFCFDLLVRPASAPWFVTAGVHGVWLHDADGTSTVLLEQPTAIAFYGDGRLVAQEGQGNGFPSQPTGPIVVYNGTQSSETPLDSNEALLDVAVSDDRLLALVSGPSGSSIIDLNTGESRDIGPSSVEARLHGDVALLRSSADRLEARSLDGALLWDEDVDNETMVVPGDPGVVRLDRFGELNVEYGFRQYLSTRLIDADTGAELDSYEYELAIPNEGDEITEQCLRAELRDGILLCPQSDGRLVTLRVEGGDMFDFPAGREGIGTYVRGER